MTDATDIASRIDHTILAAEASAAQVDQVIDEALQHRFAAVCVNPIFISHVRARLRESDVQPCTVIGFPLGANTAAMKAGEAAMAVRSGAAEVDVVCHLPHLLAEDLLAARGELMEVVYAVREIRRNVVVKAIIESALLLRDVSADQGEARIKTACQAVREAGCDFIKTSTGFHPAGGASVEAVRLMAQHGENLKVKASGGVRTRADAEQMLHAGADRLGCSASVSIVADV
ncbi:MAG: deoxyribose-phosphate aldolase [Phycisphaeraceae bacterium]